MTKKKISLTDTKPGFSKKNLGIIALAVFIFLASAVVAYTYFTYQRIVVDSSPNPSTPTEEPTATPDPNRPYNLLLLGHGDPNHSGGQITDTMIVAHIAPLTETVTLISIPRDIWVSLPLTSDKNYERKINHAYAIGNNDRDYQKQDRYSGKSGGINLAKDTIEQVTGLSIDYTVAINFSAFVTSIDTLGGITVDVPVSFVDEYYPIVGEEDNPCNWSEEDIAAMTATMSGFLLEQQFGCRYERLEFSRGPQLMNGITALKYVRSRHSDTHGNDFNRALRQQTVIKAIRDKVVSIGSLPRLIPLINTLSASIKTDVNLASIPTLWQYYTKWSDYEIQNLTLSTDNVLVESRSQDRQYILISKSGLNNWQSVQEYIQVEINRPPTP